METPERAIRITPDMLIARRLDFERSMRKLPPATLGILAALVAVFAIEVHSGALWSAAGLVQAGALTRAGVMAGQWWRLVTAIFLHGSLEHLLGNALALLALGMVCEHAFGRAQFLFLFLASGVAGSVLSIVLGPGPSVGASGAIFGLQGAAIVLFRGHRDRLILRSRRIGIVLIAWAVYTIALGVVSPFIDNGAHIGGFIGGALVARSLHPIVLDPAPPDVQARIHRQAWVTVAVVALAVVAALVRH